MKPGPPNLAPAEPQPAAAVAEPVVTRPDALREELASQNELHLRLAADFDNFKRRSRQESETRAAAQKESFILELLPVIDNLERALASGATPGSQHLRQGVEMTLHQLRSLLRQHGIESDESVGQKFDPHQHEAVSQRRDPSHPDHAILEVFQRGYRQGQKILRAAKVVVNDLTHHKRSGHAR